LNTESTVYHPMSLIAEKVKAEKYLTAPIAVPVINSSYIANLYQCEPAPKAVPSSFYRSIPGKEEQLKKVLAQDFTLGVVKKRVLARRELFI
jgi:hypothetical protein